jgi:hypothetical protein
LQDKIFSYLCYMFDECGCIPSEDELYEQFQLQFDNYYDFDEVAIPAVQQFARIHDITGIEIRWEGELFEDHRKYQRFAERAMA